MLTMPPSKRKAQLRDIAERKKKRRAEHYSDNESVAAEELEQPDEDRAADAMLDVEQPGAAAVRERKRVWIRRERERTRGLAQPAQAMAAWLASAVPIVAANDSATTDVTNEIVTAVLDDVVAELEEEEATQRRKRRLAQAAADERER